MKELLEPKLCNGFKCFVWLNRSKLQQLSLPFMDLDFMHYALLESKNEVSCCFKFQIFVLRLIVVSPTIVLTSILFQKYVIRIELILSRINSTDILSNTYVTISMHASVLYVMHKKFMYTCVLLSLTSEIAELFYCRNS